MVTGYCRHYNPYKALFGFPNNHRDIRAHPLFTSLQLKGFAQLPNISRAMEDGWLGSPLSDGRVDTTSHTPESLACSQLLDTGSPIIQYRLYKRRFSGLVALVSAKASKVFPNYFILVNCRYF